jgi:hypothetical protein
MKSILLLLLLLVEPATADERPQAQCPWTL